VRKATEILDFNHKSREILRSRSFSILKQCSGELIHK